jgi:hypothetical protein
LFVHAFNIIVGGLSVHFFGYDATIVIEQKGLDGYSAFLASALILAHLTQSLFCAS